MTLGHIGFSTNQIIFLLWIVSQDWAKECVHNHGLGLLNLQAVGLLPREILLGLSSHAIPRGNFLSNDVLVLICDCSGALWERYRGYFCY